MITGLAFVAAAAVGAVARAEVGRRWNRHGELPLGTLAVNVTGSFALGLLVDVGAPTITVLGVAGLGAFTTFSSVARDVVALVEQERLGLAAAYLAATLSLGIGAAGAGVAIAT